MQRITDRAVLLRTLTLALLTAASVSGQQGARDRAGAAPRRKEAPKGGQFTTPNGQRGAMLRAYNKATGVEEGAVYMPGAQTGSPMTYMAGGKQDIVVAVSGAVTPGELIAYRLP